MIIRRLQYSDINNYIILIKKFRNIELNEKQFNETLNKIKENGDIIICEFDNKIVGTLTVLIEQKFIHNYAKYGHIEDIFVDPEYQKKGIASKLIQEGINICKSEKCLKCKLNCYQNLEQLYLKNNFSINGISMINLLS